MLGDVLTIGRTAVVVASLMVVCAQASAQIGYIERYQVEPGVYAVLRNGNTIFLECTPPLGKQARPFLEKYLVDGGAWKMYADKGAVAIHFDKLRPEIKRQALLAVFPLDCIDEKGWWHVVRFDASGCGESLTQLAVWLTGSPGNVTLISARPENQGIHEELKRSDRILVPRSILLPAMRAFKAPPPLPEIPPIEARSSSGTAEAGNSSDSTPGIAFPFANGDTEGLLEYHGTLQDGHAVYCLRPGESLYSAVVVRFTDYRENSDILDACGEIAKCSGIRDMHRIKAGQKILIPVDMLADRFKPAGSDERKEYESVRAEEQRLARARVRSKDLEGVVVILDSGHGGHDHGAAIEPLGLYEDEINYDIVSRIKAILETETRAKVYVTVYDPKQGYTPSNATRFSHDTREVLTTTPNYDNSVSDVSLILRYSLANDIYSRERKQGTDEQKIIFTSIHCDYLFNETLRGAMVYVPGAKRRTDPSASTAKKYTRYEEVRRNPVPTTTASMRKRDEALSWGFANTLLDAMRVHQPSLKVHDAGPPVRNVIRKGKGNEFLPAVLRYNVVPTKVLIEVANTTNSQDQQRLADPKWRQWFAEAYVDALRKHYNH